MSNVKIIKGNLFDAPKGSIIVHACNAQGMWGSGIAKQFAVRYPAAYSVYQEECGLNNEPDDILTGTCLIIGGLHHVIGCLFTSSNYGSKVSPPKTILAHTRTAILDLIEQNFLNKEIHMCKINSGLFRVPWELTQEVLEEFPEQEFTVYDF